VVVDGAALAPITAFALSEIDFAVTSTSRSTPVHEALALVSMEVELLGEILLVDDPALPSAVFDTAGMDIDSTPAAALSDDDTKRFAYHGAFYLMRLLIGESLESRDAHSHTLPCGTLDVTPESGTGLPVMVADWSQCEDLGLFMSGDFTLRWTNLDGGDTMTLG
jgi:hypothetical protein